MFVYVIAGVNKSRAPATKVLYTGAYYLCVLNLEMSWSHLFGVQTFEIVPRFGENFYTPVLWILQIHVWNYRILNPVLW